MDFEIHGGGSDLIFPHHENEIAQTEAARGEPLARIWMHNGMVELGDEKMAKSVGNIRLLHGALEQFGRDAFLMWFVGAHYRKPIAYTRGDARGGGARGRPGARVRPPAGRRRAGRAATSSELAERFFDALADDFNTAGGARRAVRLGRRGQPAPRRGRARRAPGGSARCCRRFGLENLLAATDEQAAGGDRAAGRGAPGGPRRARLRARRPAARRAGGARVGGPRHGGGPAARPRRDRLRAQPRARGAARKAARPPRLRHRARPARCGSATWTW